MRRLDLPVAALIVALCALAVIRQLGSDPLEPYEAAFVRTIGVGEALEPDVTLRDIGDERRRIGDWFGKKGTIFYAWSTTCPCIPFCEKEMRTLYATYGPKQGYTWIGVAGEPTDTREGVLQEMTRLGSFYKMVLDPSHRLCKRLGFDRAAVLAVLDGDGYLRFRGNLQDDLKKPTKNYLAPVLTALDAGRLPEVGETELAYGCEFSAPVACEDAVEPTGPPVPDSAP